MSALGTVKAGAEIWLFVKPIRRVKKALNKRRARKGKPLLEIRDDKEIAMGKELFGSLARHFLPVATTYLASQGIVIGDGTDPIFALVIGGVVYGAMQAWSFIRKIKNKPREV